MTSKTPEWNTPQHIVAATLRLFKNIDLDPCADAGLRIPAGCHYTKQDNGLQYQWFGKVYLNPPYGRQIGVWVKKLMFEYSCLHVTEAVVLLPARTDTKWFIRLCEHPVLFLDGRLKFNDGSGSAPFPSAICYLGPNLLDFQTAFGHLGRTYIPLEYKIT